MRRHTPHQYATALSQLSHDLPREKLPQLAEHFIGLLARRREIKLIPRIVAALEKINLETGEAVTVHLSTARSVSNEAELAQEFAQVLKIKHVELKFTQEPALIGGARLRIGDMLVDGSVHGLLSQFTKTL